MEVAAINIFEVFGSIGLKDEGFTSGINNALEKGEGFASKIGGIAATAGKAMAVGLGAAATAFTGLAAKALSLGGDLEQNLGGAEAVFGEFADTIKEKGTAAFSAMGLSQSDFLANANKMGALLQGMGFDIAESMNLSTDVMQRAADVASVMGISTAEAMQAVTGAAKGNFTMMDNLGVAMNATTIEAYALSKGINTSYNEMSNQVKIGLAMEMFLEKTAYATGNYAKENETLAGALSTAKAALTNFLSGAGDVGAVVESVSNLADVVMDKIGELLPRLTTGLGSIVQQLIPKIPPILQELLPAILTGATTLLDGVMSALPDLMAVLVGVLPMAVESILSMLPMVLQTGIDIIIALAQGIADALPWLIPAVLKAIYTLEDTLLNSIPMIVDAALQLVQGLVQGIIDAVPLMADAAPHIWQAFIDALMKSLPMIYDAMTELLYVIVEVMPVISQAVLETFPILITAIVDSINENKELVADAALNLLMALVEVLPVVIELFISNFVDIWGMIVDLLISLAPTLFEIGLFMFGNMVKGWLAVLEPAADAITEAILPIVLKAKSTFEEAVQTITAIWNNLPEILGEIASSAVAALVSGFASAGGQLMSSITSLIQSIIGFFAELPNRAVTVGASTISMLWQGIQSGVSSFNQSVSDFVMSVVDYFLTLPDRLVEAGRQMIEGLWKGIQDGSQWLADQMDRFLDSFISGVNEKLGIHSPSRIFGDMGRNIIKSFADSALDMAGYANRAMDDVFGGLSRDVDVNVNTRRSAFASSDEATAQVGNGAVRQNITVVVQADSLQKVTDLFTLFEDFQRFTRADEPEGVTA